MGPERLFLMERVGGRRRSLVDERGGAEWAVAAFLGPLEAGVDLLREGRPVAEVRGMGLPDGGYAARIAGGEALRVAGAPPRLAVTSDRRAPTAVLVAVDGSGWRSLTWSEDGALAGVLRTLPSSGGEAWRLEIAGHVDPVRTAALLLAADRLLRERDRAGAG